MIYLLPHEESSMARTRKKLQLIRSTLLLVALSLVFSGTVYSQSNPTEPKPAEPKSQVSPSTHEPDQTPADDPKTELSPTATPEELRQAQIEADTKKLYQLSAELRAEVAKTYKESLSLTVLKKAEEVEKVARNLKVLMDQEAAAARH
jgi:hypothetical protein